MEVALHIYCYVREVVGSDWVEHVVVSAEREGYGRVLGALCEGGIDCWRVIVAIVRSGDYA